VCTAQSREVRVCTVQFREALSVYCTVWRDNVCILPSYRGTVFVLHSVGRHCVCTAQSREALCVYCTV